jgi:hypothetical protein
MRFLLFCEMSSFVLARGRYPLRVDESQFKDVLHQLFAFSSRESQRRRRNFVLAGVFNPYGELLDWEMSWVRSEGPCARSLSRGSRNNVHCNSTYKALPIRRRVSNRGQMQATMRTLPSRIKQNSLCKQTRHRNQYLMMNDNSSNLLAARG